MGTRAKFKCQSVGNGRVFLTPVYSEDPNSENKKFWDATPSGVIELYIKNDAAFQYFVGGKEYYVDFIEAS